MENDTHSGDYQCLWTPHTAQVTTGISPASNGTPPASQDAIAEDINNPLMEGVAQLSITPSGQRRMS